MLSEFLFGKPKKQKKIKPFSGTVNRKRITVYAKSPASAARILYKKVPNFKSKGVRKIIVKNAKGKLFAYRVKLVKTNTEVNYEGSTSVKYKYYRWACGRDKRLDQVWGDQSRTGVSWTK